MVTSKRCIGYDPSTPGLETIVIANWPEHVAPGPLTNAAMIDVLPNSVRHSSARRASSPARNISPWILTRRWLDFEVER